MTFVREARLALIARAVAWLDDTPSDEVVRQLVSDPSIRLRNEWRTNPVGLADHLRTVGANSDSAALFGAYKAAQNVLLAAGLPHMTDDHA
ncbi:hypothetical protein AB0L65_32950 [Nonomuraea sp. NPDC052116]|uniref:hypothetical protein n=1 Tax=Nonomuraea sp. NPDC052116 TaxID=3155665 RepID=UPI00342EC123